MKYSIVTGLEQCLSLSVITNLRVDLCFKLLQRQRQSLACQDCLLVTGTSMSPRSPTWPSTSSPTPTSTTSTAAVNEPQQSLVVPGEGSYYWGLLIESTYEGLNPKLVESTYKGFHNESIKTLALKSDVIESAFRGKKNSLRKNSTCFCGPIYSM